MQKVILTYNDLTGDLIDSAGIALANVGGGIVFNDADLNHRSKADDIVKLKTAGFEANEIMQMIREGLV